MQVDFQHYHDTASNHPIPTDDLSTVRSDWFNWVMHDAYNSDRGYAVATNPYTGEKVMVVAGTRNARDWIANAYELASGRSKFARRWERHKYREHYQDFLSNVAKREGVQSTVPTVTRIPCQDSAQPPRSQVQ